MRAVGILLLGVTVGLQYGLLAVGLVLIYRASRFISFVQGQLGVFAAIVLARLAIEADLPYLVALLAGLAAAAATAVVIERGVIQRLFDAPRLVLVVATIALTQGLFAVTQFKGFHLGDRQVVPGSPLRLDQGEVTNNGGFPVPFRGTLSVGGVVLDSAQLLTLVAGPLIVLGLYLLFTRTRLGRSIRAASSNPEAARLAGISVRRVSLTVWVLAGVLSGLAAVLGAPSQPTVTASLLGPALLLRGIAAGMIAGFVDFRLAFLGGVVVGVVEQVAQYNLRSSGITDVAVLVVLLIGLLWRGRVLAGSFRRGDDALVSERSRTEVTEVVGRWRQAIANVDRLAWFALVAVLAVLPLLPGLRSQAQSQALVQIVSIAICGLSLSLLTGWAGQISLGHFALLGVGAYVTAQTMGDHRWALPAVLLVSGLVTAALAVVVGLPAVRFRGLFLAVTTLALAVLGPSWLFYQRVLGSDGGAASIQLHDVRLPFGGHVGSYTQLYGIALGLFVLIALGLHALRQSGAGRALIAVRDNDRAAASAGIPPTATKLVALALSGFIAGIAGSLWGIGQSTFGPSAFDAGESLTMLSVALVGGLGTLAGPLLGAIAVYGFPLLVPGQNNVVIRALFSTSLLLTVLLYFPGGIMSLVYRAREALLRRTVAATPPAATDADDEIDIDLTVLEAAVGEAVVQQPGGRFGPVPGAAPLVVEGVSISFGGLRALDEVSIRVEPGEIVGLIGGNGAGKTTLMNCISGHLRPDAGTITVFGRPIGHLPPEFRAELGLARSFQDAALYPGLTVLETTKLGLDHADRSGTLGSFLGSPWVAAAEQRKSERARRTLKTLGLDDRSSSLTSELSTGMRRLTDLGAVIAARPGLVLLDEPTAGIAQREVEEFGPLLLRLRDDLGCSIVLIEHDMPLVMSISDRIYCLESGGVIAEGPPEAIQGDPAVIASYLGTNEAAIARSGSAGPA